MFTRTTFLAVLFVAGMTIFGKAQDSNPVEVAKKKKAEVVKLTDVRLARGAISLRQPISWKAPKSPRSRIIEREFSVPKAEGDKSDGRLTMMRSGGSLQANVDRWLGQFSQPDGKTTKEVAKVVTKKINDQEVTIVDITGTFSERMGGGPFAPGKTVKRPDYRMLGGIVQTKASGQYFFKLYGPKKTIASAEKQFMAMIESVKSTSKTTK